MRLISRVARLTAIFLLACITETTVLADTVTELEAALDSALLEERADYQERLALVHRVDAFLNGKNNVYPPLYNKARLVEDNTAVAQVLEMMLESLGMIVTVSPSAEAARSRVEEGPADIDVVLSDVQMPGSMNGKALAAWIYRTVPNVSVVLMSGFADAGPEELPCEILQKPLNQDTLARSLLRTLAAA